MSREQRIADQLLGLSRPQTAVILGTGLGIMEDAVTIKDSIAYSEIDGFPQSTVSSHSGRLIMGTLGNTEVAVMSGRFHLYEGYSAAEVTLPIRVFARMGIKRLLISNAAGGLRPELTPGSAMLITDHINFTGRNPLIGPNDETLGPRFPDMTEPYSRELRSRALEIADKKGVRLHQGTYIQVNGPSMETAAETRMFQRLGADAVGMSTVMEVIQAVHCGMEVMGISAITNNNDPDHYKPAPLEEVIAMANAAGPQIAAIFEEILA